MKIEEAKKVQERIAKEAIALMVIQSEGSEKADSRVEHYKEAVTLLGRAWGLPQRIPRRASASSAGSGKPSIGSQPVRMPPTSSRKRNCP